MLGSQGAPAWILAIFGRWTIMELGLKNQESKEAVSLGDRDTRNWESNSVHSESSSFMRILAGVLPYSVRH